LEEKAYSAVNDMITILGVFRQFLPIFDSFRHFCQLKLAPFAENQCYSRYFAQINSIVE
jgi:hypothetical protein